MASENGLKFHDALEFAKEMIKHADSIDIKANDVDIKDTSSHQALQQIADDTDNYVNNQIANYIETFMKKFIVLTIENQQSIMKFFLGDSLLHMTSEGIFDEFKKENPDEAYVILRMKCSQLLSEVAKQDLEIRTNIRRYEALKLLLNDKCEDVLFLTDKVEKLEQDIRSKDQQIEELKSLLEDKSTDIAFFTHDQKEMKDIIKRMAERLQTQDKQIAEMTNGLEAEEY